MGEIGENGVDIRYWYRCMDEGERDESVSIGEEFDGWGM